MDRAAADTSTIAAPDPASCAAASSVVIPDDLATCQALLRQLHEALHKAQRQNEQLQHRLLQLLKARFGPRADRMDPAQMLLTFATEVLAQPEKPAAPDPAAARPAEKTPSSKNGHGRRRLPADLPRTQVVHDLTDEEKRCPCCGEDRTRIGQETSEQLEYEPAKLFVIEHVRPTYACTKCEGNVQTAVKPLQPIDKGLAGPSLLAHVVTAKYSDHLPLYRQEEILGRSGQKIPRSTTCGWMASGAALVRPLVGLMNTLVLQSAVIHTDDTVVPVLDPQRDKTREARLWVYAGDRHHPYIVFDYTPTRNRDGPAAFFGKYAGYIQADAFAGYDHLFKPKGDAAPVATEVACWAHARRKFVESQSSDSLRAHTAAAMIRLLYEIEREAQGQAEVELEEIAANGMVDDRAREMRLGDLLEAARLGLRREKAVPRLAQIREWLDAQQRQVLPRSPMGQAIGYCLSNWTALTRYTDSGILNIDNNIAENAIRPIVLGRKNWLFAGSDNGGRTGATLASLVASAKRHGLDPYAYLRDVFTRIAATPIAELEQFLPDRWKAAHAAVRSAAHPADHRTQA